MDIEWLSKLGAKGLEKLMQRTVDKAISARVSPELKDVRKELSSLRHEQNTRFTGLDSELKGIRDKFDALESRLQVSEELGRLKADVALLKARL